jgi:hypothetical protein
LMIFICNAGDEDNTADAYELNDLLQERFKNAQKKTWSIRV